MGTILWDLDGTIADTEELHFRAWQQILEDYDVEYDEAAFRAGFGRSNRSVVSELFGVDPDAPVVAEVSIVKEARFRSLLATSDLKLLPGVADWLAAFREAGRLQVISSSGPMANIAATVAKLDIGDYFITLMSGATLPHGKPHPAIFLRSAAATETPPAACIVIEDSTHGIAAARRGSIPCVAVGKLATDPALTTLLAREPGPACLPLPTLTELDWSAVKQLEDPDYLRATDSLAVSSFSGGAVLVHHQQRLPYFHALDPRRRCAAPARPVRATFAGQPSPPLPRNAGSSERGNQAAVRDLAGRGR